MEDAIFARYKKTPLMLPPINFSRREGMPTLCALFREFRNGQRTERDIEEELDHKVFNSSDLPSCLRLRDSRNSETRGIRRVRRSCNSEKAARDAARPPRRT